MSVRRLLGACLVLLAATSIGCRADAAPSPVTPTPDLERIVSVRVQGTMSAQARATAPPAPAPPPPDRQGTAVARVRATLTAVPPAGSTPTPGPTVTPRPQEDPVTIEGQLNAQTQPFKLLGGNYMVAWRVTPRLA